MKIIDEHRHIGLSGARGNPSAEDIIAELDRYDIDHAIVAPGDRPRRELTRDAEVAATMNLYETVSAYLASGVSTPEIETLHSGVPYHDEVLAAARSTDGRLLGCWLLNPFLGEEEFQRVRSAVRSDGFRYIKLHPPMHAFAADDPEVLAPVMTLARQLDVPVWIHSSSGPGTEVSRLRNLARGFPEVDIVMGHVFVHEGLPEEEGIPAVVEAALQHPNLWVDLSHARPASVQAILDQGPQDRIMFATDDPWDIELSTQDMLDSIRAAAGEDRVLLEKVLGANAARLMRVG